MRSPPHRTIHLDNAGWGKLDALLREHDPRVPPDSEECRYCDPLCIPTYRVCNECARVLTGLELIHQLPVTTVKFPCKKT